MEPGSSSPCSQEATLVPTPHYINTARIFFFIFSFLMVNFNIIIKLFSCSEMISSLWNFGLKFYAILLPLPPTLYVPPPPHYPYFEKTTLFEQYRSWSSPLCNFLESWQFLSLRSIVDSLV